MQRIAFFVVAVSFLVAAQTARGVDGVLEINQTCAVNTGCFAGDTPGFPVTVTASGVSLRLTSGLTVPDANTRAIYVTGDSVTIDLNGFTIQGPNVCTGVPVSCQATDGGEGIFSDDSVNVSNGNVDGMGGGGLFLGGLSRVTGITATSNGGSGIGVGSSSVVSGCVTARNAFDGISGLGSVIRDNVSYTNGIYGIDTSLSTVIGNTINRNGSFGLWGGNSSAYGSNQLDANNGGNGNPQVGGVAYEIAPNVCGGDLVCP